MKTQDEHHQLIEKGLQLAASLPDIMPPQASAPVAAIYNDIQHSLRVPLVNLVFRTLANYPDYLAAMWQHFSPAFRTMQFEQEADNLREKALLESIPETVETAWTGVSDLAQLRAFNDTIFYVLPKLLLVTTTFYEASFRGLTEPRPRRGETPPNLAEIPLGPAEGSTKVSLTDPEKASEEVKALFEDIKAQHEHPMVSSYYRGLANWPDFLQESWQVVRPVVGSPAYKELSNFLVEQAQLSLRRLPLSQPQQITGLDDNQAEEVKALLAAFRYKFIPEMLIDATLIKALLDGPEEAFSSRFSVISADEEE